MENTSAQNTVHMGQNIRKFRKVRGKSQVDLAVELEARLHKPFSQQLVSDIENRISIEDEELLRQIADFLKVDPEVIKKMDFEAALNVFGNTFNPSENSQAFVTTTTFNQTIHPLDKLIELFEKEKAEWKSETEKLRAEIEALKQKK